LFIKEYYYEYIKYINDNREDIVINPDDSEDEYQVDTQYNNSYGGFSSIYLLTLGYVKDLRQTFNIPADFDDSHIVVKYGRTDDLSRRLSEHQKKYNKLTNVNCMLKLYSHIDNELASEAETVVSNFFSWGKYTLEHPEYQEIAIVPPNSFDIIKKEYDIIKNKFGGNSVEIIHKFDMLEKNHEITLLKKDKELELKEKDNQLLQKEVELLQLKLQLAQMKK
jgi:hypothetical protein